MQRHPQGEREGWGVEVKRSFSGRGKTNRNILHLKKGGGCGTGGTGEKGEQKGSGGRISDESCVKRTGGKVPRKRDLQRGTTRG